MNQPVDPAAVAIVIAIFRPARRHLAEQFESFAHQTVRPQLLVCVIADLESASVAEELAAAHDFPVEIVIPSQAMDAPRAFEAGLARAVKCTAPGSFIALSDQDDIWHPDRLERGLAAMRDPDVTLAHGDARLVGPEGDELQPSMFGFERRHRNPGLRGLLYRNNITGMTILFRRDLAELSLPFPAQAGVHFYHDLWIGLLAAAVGRIALIETPIVDYRQHGGNVIGAVDRTGRKARRLPRLGIGTRGRMRHWLRRKATSYALAKYLAKSVQGRISESVIGNRLAPDGANTRPLKPYLRRRGLGTMHLVDATRLLFTGHPELARIAACQALVVAGRFSWALRDALTHGLIDALRRFDARLFSLSPGIAPPEIDPAGNVVMKDLAIAPSTALPPKRTRGAASYIDARKRPAWRAQMDAPEPALTLLVPTLNPSEAFAGIATAIDIGIGLAARGHRVRMIATDLPVANPAASRAFVENRIGPEAAGAMARISIHCGLQGDGQGDGSGAVISQHPDDIFLATAWWTAHVASELIARHEMSQRRFLYLIQDFEPNFYAWGTVYADAMASYTMDYVPIYNTTLLRDYFVAQGLGDASALAFRPSIDISRYSSGARAIRTGPRRLALYGRPEVERNMFPMAIEALQQFLTDQRLSGDDIELVSVGLKHEPVEFSGGARLKSLGKLPWEDYPAYLLTVDLALSLMYSPHPSHPPIEMAASGVHVVTNGFGPKNLGQLSDALTSVAPTPKAIAAALGQAWSAGPVSAATREIDLAPLGLAMDELLNRLSGTLETMSPRGGSK